VANSAARTWRTVVMTGDGGFLLNPGELWTAVQEALDVSVIVMNDRGYDVIKRIQDVTAQGRFFSSICTGPTLGSLPRSRSGKWSVPTGLARLWRDRLRTRGRAWWKSI
jgi:acetolactate synthase-1/2/3 large subunit